MSQANDTYHIPVLLQECLDGLEINPSGIYVDVTFGGGGHSRAILEKLGPEGKLIAFDQDVDAQANAIDDDRFTLVPMNFKFMANQLKYLGYEGKVDGILADLGVSSHQFDVGERGFSTRFEGPLDMRMNQNADLSAAEFLNKSSAEDIANALFKYGEIKNSRAVAAAIVSKRQEAPLKTTQDLIKILEGFVPAPVRNKFYAQVFQAVRIEINQEIRVLERFLEQSVQCLKTKGKLVVISYHSLEDRLVKNFLKSGSFDGELDKDFFGNVHKPYKQKGSKPIIPTVEEQARNTRSRSAKLRIAERLKEVKR